MLAARAAVGKEVHLDGPAIRTEGLTKHYGDVVALVKPQFEAGRREVGKGGIVRDDAVRARVVEEVAARGAGLLAPLFERSGGRYGRLSAQVDPRRARDAEGMLVQAERLFALAPGLTTVHGPSA